MKVCFINPPFKAEYGKFSRESRSPSIGHSGVLYYPLWLIYAACVAEKNGFDVSFIDAPAKRMNKEQTLPTDDFVLVCDGPLNEALDDIIAEKQREMGVSLNVIRLAKNGGLGNALNEGIKHCKNELIARMDSDDIAYPDRCEKQLAVFDAHPEVSICSGIVEEFTTDPRVVDSKRVLPETNEAIMEFAKKRNPFNHPCVMYKKSAVEAVDSYQDFYLLEDYYLWLRMLMAGYQGYNLQEPLLHMRAGSDMYKRRAGWKYAKAQAKLFRYMRDRGFIGNGQYIKSCVIRSGSALAPNWIRKNVFKYLLRK